METQPETPAPPVEAPAESPEVFNLFVLNYIFSQIRQNVLCDSSAFCLLLAAELATFHFHITLWSNPHYLKMFRQEIKTGWWL